MVCVIFRHYIERLWRAGAAALAGRDFRDWLLNSARLHGVSTKYRLVASNSASQECGF